VSDSLTRRGLLRRGGAVAGTAALGGIAGGALAASRASAQEPDGEPWNVLLIVASGLRSDSIGAFDGAFDDNVVARTPNLDELAGGSLRFERAVPESTPAVPARKALVCGTESFPFRDWLRTEPFAPTPGWNRQLPRMPLLTETLEAGGVETVWITDNPLFSGPRYDRFVERTTEVDAADYPAPASAKGETLGREQTRAQVEDLLVGNIERGAQAMDRAVDAGIEQLERLQGGQFFLAVDAFDPAEAFYPPRTWTRSLELDPSLGAPWVESEWVVRADVDDETVAIARQAYMDGVEQVDGSVGRLLDRLDGIDGAERTIVWFVSDGHTMLGEHGWLGRGAPGSYQHAYFAPFLLRDPDGRRSGNYSYYYASTHDVAPTLLSMLGIDIPGKMTGEDLTALLDEEDPPKRTAFMSSCVTNLAVGDPRWLMLTDFEGGQKRLHDFDEDNDKDDDERENVVRKYPHVVEELWKRPLAVAQGTFPVFGEDAPIVPPDEDDDKDDDGIPDRRETNDEQSGDVRDADQDELDFDQTEGEDVELQGPGPDDAVVIPPKEPVPPR
jgi:arylsulfatase A-like enzyme